MKHERVYYTCDGCGNELSEEGHTVVTADYTGYREPTENDGKSWDLCAGCWLTVFAVLDHQARRLRGEETAKSLREDLRTSTNWFENDDLRPWDS